MQCFYRLFIDLFHQEIVHPFSKASTNSAPVSHSSEAKAAASLFSIGPCVFPRGRERWIFIVLYCSHAHLITRFPPGGEITDCYSSPPLNSLWIMQVLQCVTPLLRLQPSWLVTRRRRGQNSHAPKKKKNTHNFSAPSSAPWAASTQRNEKPRRAWTYGTDTDLHEELKTEPPCVPPCHNTPTQPMWRVSQASGCAALRERKNTGALRGINLGISDLQFKITPTTLILIGDRSCFALGVSSCRQVS